jgi:hypothetical protein
MAELAKVAPHLEINPNITADGGPGQLGQIDEALRDVVRSRRLELPPVLPDSDLNAARLPIPPRPQKCSEIFVQSGADTKGRL